MTKRDQRLYNYQKSFTVFLRENIDHYLCEGVKLNFKDTELLVSCAEALCGMSALVRQAIRTTRGDDLP